MFMSFSTIFNWWTSKDQLLLNFLLSARCYLRLLSFKEINSDAIDIAPRECHKYNNIETGCAVLSGSNLICIF